MKLFHSKILTKQNLFFALIFFCFSFSIFATTAEYKGEVKKIVNDTVTYTAVFTEVPKDNHFLSYWWAYLLGLLGLGGGGYGAYRLIRKRRKGY